MAGPQVPLRDGRQHALRGGRPPLTPRRDRLRELIDLVVASADDAGADGRALAGRAHFSRDHLDRLLGAATGETPVALRRRLLLERAAWALREGASASEVAPVAGFGSLAAFSRAFARAYGIAPSRFAAAGRDVHLDAPNGIHFHPPAGLLVPRPAPAPGTARDVLDRLLGHHLDRTRELLEAAAALPADARARPLRPGQVIVDFDGEEATAGLVAERLVRTLEVWVAAIAGAPWPAEADPAPLVARHDRAARAFARIVRDLRARGAWDDAFVDALCEPPQSFTYGGVVAHVLSFGAVRREALAAMLEQLGAPVDRRAADPIAWEQSPAVRAATGGRAGQGAGALSA